MSLPKPQRRALAAGQRAPIVVCGCGRTGTLLMARILGGCDGHFLVTEHRRMDEQGRKLMVPEDRSGIVDNELWWNALDYPQWESGRRRPVIEAPCATPAGLEQIRRTYLDAASGRRLVTKNPSHLMRVSLLETILPDAFFVYCARNPWHTIQSMIIGGKGVFLLRSATTMQQPDDLLLRAASSWSEANRLYRAHRNERWIAVRYEDVLGDPVATLERVFSFLHIADRNGLTRGAALPRRREHDYDFIRDRLAESPYRKRILEIVANTAEWFGYTPSPEPRIPAGS